MGSAQHTLKKDFWADDDSADDSDAVSIPIQTMPLNSAEADSEASDTELIGALFGMESEQDESQEIQDIQGSYAPLPKLIFNLCVYT